MSEKETDPKKIVALLNEEYWIDPNPANWSANEELHIEHIVTEYVEQLDPEALTKLILQAENETARVEEFIDTLCNIRQDFAGDEPDWLTLLQAMAGFILTRAVESESAAVAA